MSTFAKLLIVAAIASVMAIVGMELIALRQGEHTDLSILKMVVPLSIFLWFVLSLILRGRSLLVGVYVGFLSPFLGGILMVPAILIVLTNLAICIGIGIATGLLVAVALRIGGET